MNYVFFPPDNEKSIEAKVKNTLIIHRNPRLQRINPNALLLNLNLYQGLISLLEFIVLIFLFTY